MTEQAARPRGVWAFLKREPLVHFLGLAALLFIGNAVFSGDEREVITVDVPTREYIIEQQQSLLLRNMSDEEKAAAVEDFIEEEILVREARKRGFENSSRIRALLIRNMRFFITSETRDPTEEDLQRYFEENIERFETKPSITYDQVVFSDPDTVPADTLAALRGGADHRAIGDTTVFTALAARAGERQIVATFGREQAPVILGIDDDQWHGPFASNTRVHFLRVAERHPGGRPTFESAKQWLEQEWRLTKGREIVARELAVMRENYRIEVLQPEPET